jgi:hypothetical protein
VNQSPEPSTEPGQLQITTLGKSFRMRKRNEPAEEASTKTTKSSKNR